MNVTNIALRGFLMPIYALLGGVIAYTINQLIIAFQGAFQNTSSSNSSFPLPTYGIITLCFVIMGIMMTVSGYFDDLSGYVKSASHGFSYPVQAIIYALGAVVGLALFWNAIGDVTIGGIGPDALYSSTASVVILVVTALYSLLT